MCSKKFVQNSFNVEGTVWWKCMHVRRYLLRKVCSRNLIRLEYRLDVCKLEEASLEGMTVSWKAGRLVGRYVG